MCCWVYIYINIKYRFLLICLDSYMLNTDTIPDTAKNYINPLLYNRPIWMRIIIGNTIPVYRYIL